jgi:hypothetical protein
LPRDDGGLRALFLEHLPVVHWQSIESGITGLGIPDANGCWGGHEWWVEYKQTPEWTCPLRPEQVGWLTRRARAGGRVFVAVRRHCAPRPRTPGYDELWLFPGALARELKDGGIRAVPPLVAAPGGPARWPWDDVLRTLACWCPAP